MIEEAKRRTPGKVDCVLADVLADPLPARTTTRSSRSAHCTTCHCRIRCPCLRPLYGPEGSSLPLPCLDRTWRHELPAEIVAAAGHRLLGAMFLVKRSLGSSGGFAKDSARSAMPVVMDPPLTTREVASQAAAVLPGVRVRRLLFWRYLLIWQKPVHPDS